MACRRAPASSGGSYPIFSASADRTPRSALDVARVYLRTCNPASWRGNPENDAVERQTRRICDFGLLSEEISRKMKMRVDRHRGEEHKPGHFAALICVVDRHLLFP
jgi:hypothetical protein